MDVVLTAMIILGSLVCILGGSAIFFRNASKKAEERVKILCDEKQVMCDRLWHESRSHKKDCNYLKNEITQLKGVIVILEEMAVLYEQTRAILVPLPLPPDLVSSWNTKSCYLPRFATLPEGMVEVRLPGSFQRFHLHVIPDKQDLSQRELIYEALRNNQMIRAELGIRVIHQ